MIDLARRAARPPRRLYRTLIAICGAVALGACGAPQDRDADPDSGPGDAPGATEGPARPEARAPAQMPERPREIAEVRYTISGEYDESHEESGNVMCSRTGDGRFLAQSFQAGEDRWGISIDVEGTGAGTHDAELRLGPPRDRTELWEGRQIDDVRGRGEGRVELADSGERDGWGHSVMELDFSFPGVELQRSGRTVSVEGQFRCGVVDQS
jgi:hypothetical protein